MQATTIAAGWLRKQYPKGNDAEAMAAVYRRVFGDNKDAGLVLEDLRRAGFVYETAVRVGRDGHVDALAMAVNEGRRQMYMHIIGCLSVSTEELTKQEKKPDDNRDDRRGAAPGEPVPRARYPAGYDPALDGPEREPEPAAGGPEQPAGEPE